jgi:hypothetical protein
VFSRRLQLALHFAELVGVATLLRSVAYDRWITVLASVLLVVGAIAAQRGRAWGVGLAFGSAVAFPVAWAIGIAPLWFVLVGIFGALPFALTFRSFARFDKGATALLTFLAAAAGTLGAVAWKQYALATFALFPSLLPSLHPQHAGALMMMAVLGAVANHMRRRSPTTLDPRRGGEEQRVRIGERLRVADADEAALGAPGEATDAGDAVHERRRAHR